jgi:hypothetical protein
LSAGKLLVYIQALPDSVSTSAKKFADLESAEFSMSHSSKTALAFASTLRFPHIVAAGFSPVLQEALTRGATEIFTMPLCDDPILQASFLPEGEFTHIIAGENPDWIFSGATFCGVLAEARNLNVEIIGESGVPKEKKLSPNSLILVKDSGESTSSIDVRRILNSASAGVNLEGVSGDSMFSVLEEKKTETISGTPNEISTSLSRKLRRFAGSRQ